MMAGGASLAVTAASPLVVWDTSLCVLSQSLVLISRLTVFDHSFLAGQMHVFRPRTDLTRVLLALAPLAGATLIAISRCEDYRHDVYDVTTGSIVGMTLAYFSYRRYYPSLGSPLCDTPFPSRDETASKHEFGGARDEEAFVDHSGNFSANDSEDREEGVPLRSASQQWG